MLVTDAVLQSYPFDGRYAASTLVTVKVDPHDEFVIRGEGIHQTVVMGRRYQLSAYTRYDLFHHVCNQEIVNACVQPIDIRKNNTASEGNKAVSR